MFHGLRRTINGPLSVRIAVTCLQSSQTLILSSGKTNLEGCSPTHLINPPNVYLHFLIMLRPNTLWSPHLRSLSPDLQLASFWFRKTVRVQPPHPQVPAVVIRVQTFCHTLYKGLDTSPAALVFRGKNKIKTHLIKMQHGTHEIFRVYYTPHLWFGTLHFNSYKDQQWVQQGNENADWVPQKLLAPFT